MANRIRLTESDIMSLVKSVLHEVRYIDTKKTDQEPIMDGEKIRVFHGSDCKTIFEFCTQGVSGKVYSPRKYSYEATMNPLGLFVTPSFKTAKEFGDCVIEFTADTRDLECPVWGDKGMQASQTGIGYYTTGFANADERNAEKARFLKRTIDRGYGPAVKSDRPDFAMVMFDSHEPQALFVGDLNPNMIKRVWVVDNSGESSALNRYQPMKPEKFVNLCRKKYGMKPSATQKIFKPNDNVGSFDELIDAVYNNMGDYFRSRGEAEEGLKSLGMLSQNPPGFAVSTIETVLWPRQIIQLYGKEWFNEYFNRFGQ